MCKADDATRSFRADLRIGVECAFAPRVAAKPDDAAGSGFAGHQGQLGCPASGPRPDIATLPAPVRTTNGHAQKVLEPAVNRNVILSGDADRPYPDRFSISWHRCQGRFHLRGRQHAGRDQARARDPVLLPYVGGSWSSSAARPPRRGNRRCCTARCSDCSATRRSILRRCRC